MRIRAGGVTLGHREDGVILKKFRRVPVFSTQRTPKPMSDGSWAGWDSWEMERWYFDFGIKEYGKEASLARSRELEALWRTPEFRAPGAVTTLEYDAADTGVWKSVYGRFGGFSGVIPDNFARYGGGEALAEFEVLDPRHYSSEMNSRKIMLMSESTGGIIFPLIFPMTTTRTFSGVNARFIDVAGDAPTPLKVTFHGPLVDPCVTVDGLEVGLRGTVAEDLPIIVDSRANTVLRADGAQVHGRLTHRTRMDHLLVTPGRHEVAVTGESPTGTGRVTVTWQNATWGL